MPEDVYVGISVSHVKAMVTRLKKGDTKDVLDELQRIAGTGGAVKRGRNTAARLYVMPMPPLIGRACHPRAGTIPSVLVGRACYPDVKGPRRPPVA